MTMILALAFSSHRLETLPLAERLMHAHDLVLIEEPPSPDFGRMLSRELQVDEYLLAADYEYPTFAEASCHMLQRLQAKGRRILPSEPFTERLIDIHAHFAAGGRPAALASDERLWPVYQAERKATGRLLALYGAAAARRFDRMVEAACAFAAADAARFILRDQLRAASIARLIDGLDGKVYVEAGYLHLGLLRELRRLFPASAVIRPVFLLREVYRGAGYKTHLFGPGDLLTLAFIFDRSLNETQQHLLAARSLVYNQLIVKEEMRPGREAFPDARDDLAVIRYVNRLSYRDCRRLCGRIVDLDPQAARRAARGFPLPGTGTVPG